MYPAPFRFSRAKTIEEAETLFGESQDARYLSGGMTLIPTMKLRLVAPADVIDLNAIPGLSFVRREAEISLSVRARDTPMSRRRPKRNRRYRR